MSSTDISTDSSLPSVTNDAQLAAAAQLCSAEPQTANNCDGLTLAPTSGIFETISYYFQTKFYLIWMMAMNFVHGVSSTPIFTLGTSFLLDNSSPKTAPLYVGALYLTGAVGPAIGFLAAGFVLKVWIGGPFAGNSMSSDSPHFVGAWWLGFIMFGVMVVIMALPLFLYPESLPKNGTDEEQELNNSNDAGKDTDTDAGTENSDKAAPGPPQMSFGSNFKALPIAFCKLVSNPVFLLITLSATCEFTVVKALMTFIPKYLKVMFDIPASTAAISAGATLIPAAGVGMVLGSWLVKKYELNRTQCVMAGLASAAGAIVFLVPMMNVGCNNPSIYTGKGVLVGSDSTVDFSTGSCGEKCHCDDKFQPICENGVKTYFSACEAGCMDSEVNEFGDNLFSKCSCADEFSYSNSGKSNQSSITSTLKDGACSSGCSVYPILALLFMVTVCTTTAHTPALMAAMKSVDPDVKPMALGVQFLFYKILAYIPTPVYFGYIIDTTCLHRSENCGQQGACEIYDIEKLHSYYFGLSLGVKLVGVCLLMVTILMARRNDKNSGVKL